MDAHILLRHNRIGISNATIVFTNKDNNNKKDNLEQWNKKPVPTSLITILLSLKVNDAKSTSYQLCNNYIEGSLGHGTSEWKWTWAE